MRGAVSVCGIFRAGNPSRSHFKLSHEFYVRVMTNGGSPLARGHGTTSFFPCVTVHVCRRMARHNKTPHRPPPFRTSNNTRPTLATRKKEKLFGIRLLAIQEGYLCLFATHSPLLSIDRNHGTPTASLAASFFGRNSQQRRTLSSLHDETADTSSVVEQQ